MNTLQNIHTHTTYCDGKDAPEQIIQTALKKGFGGIGFSGHANAFYSHECCMTLAGTEEYKKEINRLKQKYKGVIDVFLGIEYDTYCNVDTAGYDYLIGAMHYLKMGDEYVNFDTNVEGVVSLIDNFFGGNGMAFAKEYYSQIACLPAYGKFDVIAHFDVITKHIENRKFFDIESKEYLSYALSAMDALRGKIPYFEVNTGAMARGYRTAPYPYKNLLREFKAMGFGAIISSDCHNAEYLDYGFGDAKKLLAENGFNEYYILTDAGFCAVPLKD